MSCKSLRAGAARRAFTLVELLAVIAIIGARVGLLPQAVQAVRESSRRTVCSNNIKEIGLATADYEQGRRVLPPGAYSTRGITWWHAVLPFLEANDVFSLYKPSYGSSASSTTPKVTNLQVCEARVPNMTCPGDTGPLAVPWTAPAVPWSKHNYVANAGNVGLTYAPVAGSAYTSRLASRDRSDTTVLNGGEPFLFTGTSNGATVLPGYTSGTTPEQVSLRKITDGLSKTMGFRLRQIVDACRGGRTAEQKPPRRRPTARGVLREAHGRPRGLPNGHRHLAALRRMRRAPDAQPDVPGTNHRYPPGEVWLEAK